MKNHERKVYKGGLRNKITRVITWNGTSKNENLSNFTDQITEGGILLTPRFPIGRGLVPVISAQVAAYYDELDVVSVSVLDSNQAPGVVYTLTGTLPAGLTFTDTGDVVTGATITGTISAGAFSSGPGYTITITATGTYGTDSVQIIFTILDPGAATPPPEISYSAGTHYLPINEVITSIDPTVISGTVTSYSIVNGSLPAGLSFSSVNGKITGNPQSSTGGNAVLEIVATGPGGDSDSVFVTINVDYKPYILYTSSPLSPTEGDDILVTPLLSGVSTYSLLSGSLPSGLSLNTSSAVVSGTIPLHGTGNFSGVVLGVNSWGSGTTNIVFNVTGIWPPTLSSMVPVVTHLVGYSNLFQESGKVTPISTSLQQIGAVENYVTPGYFDLLESLQTNALKPMYIADAGDGSPAIQFSGLSNAYGTSSLATKVENVKPFANGDTFTYILLYQLTDANAIRAGGYNAANVLAQLNNGDNYCIRVVQNDVQFQIDKLLINEAQMKDYILHQLVDGWHILVGHGPNNNQRWFYDGIQITSGIQIGIPTFGDFAQITHGYNSDNPVASTWQMRASIVCSGYNETDVLTITNTLKQIYPNIGSGTSPLLDKLASYWNLNETSGTYYDAGSGHYHFTEVSGNLIRDIPGKLGNMARTSGYSESYKITGAESGWYFNAGTENLHIAFWFQPLIPGLGTVDTVILDRSGPTAPVDPNYSIQISYIDAGSGNNARELRAVIGDGGIQWVMNQHFFFDDYELNFYEVKWTASSKTVEVRRNLGTWHSKVGTPDLSSPTLYQRMGIINTKYSPGRASGLDEIGIWKRHLNDAESYILYNQRDGITYPFTVANAEAPTDLSYDIDYITVPVYSPIPLLTPSLQGGTADEYSVYSSSLQSGILINSLTGTISGIPTEIASRTLQIKARNSVSNTSTLCTIDIQTFVPFGSGIPPEGEGY